MSKANKNSAAKAEKRLSQQAFEANQRKVRTTTTVITLSLILVLVVGIIAVSIVDSIRTNTGSYLRSEVAVSSETIEVNGAMMNYFFNDQYNNFLNYYGSYISYIGLDPTVSLKAQYADEEQGQTWFDYIMDGAVQNVTGLLAINEAAKAEGFSLTDEEKAAIEARVDELNPKNYGKGVKKIDIYNAKCLEALSYKYQLAKQNEITPNIETIEKRYADAPNNYQFIDVLAHTVSYIDPENAENSKATLTADEAKALADKLAAATDADSFKNLVKEAILAAEPEIPEEDLNNRLSALVTEGKTYADDEFSKWAFGEEAAENATYTAVDEKNFTYTVYMLTKTPYRSEDNTVNVRHILLLANDEAALKKARNEAEEILANFKAGAATEEVFGTLALQYSEDTGSCYSGGLYNNVAPGEMVEAFDAWCFDEARAAGDTGIVETEYGVHIMYFVSDGLIDWQASVSNDIINEAFTAFSTEWTTAHKSEFDPNVLAAIPA